MSTKGRCCYDSGIHSELVVGTYLLIENPR
ncbi:hypothetical protein [Xanthomonas virus PB119]|nr:hypothetical protein [Xanthomonas virus PB119]